ncbi:MAG: gluconate 2-dehydrogenase subunit 3 family protein [Bryobacteraceae bacterium]
MADNRRDALKIIGTIGATCAYPFSADELYAQHTGHAESAAGKAALPAPSYFSKADLETVTCLAGLIIPKTDTPGAVEAGVPAYIDFVVAKNKQAQGLFKRGLAWLDTAAKRKGKTRFAELDEAAQMAILQPLSDAADTVALPPPGYRRAAPPKMKPEAAFFRAIKGLTADGYYTSEIGLMRELGYNGNTALAGFPTCTHEH